MATKMTHLALCSKVVGFGKTSTFEVNLRELKNYWADQKGRKYNKSNGMQIGEKYNPAQIDRSSISEIIFN